MKDVQCYELFGEIALKNHAFSFSLWHVGRGVKASLVQREGVLFRSRLRPYVVWLGTTPYLHFLLSTPLINDAIDGTIQKRA